MRKELYIGLFALSLSLMLKQFFTVPEVIMGILLGVSISLEFIGMLPEKIYQKIKWWKKSLLMQMLNYTKNRNIV